MEISDVNQNISYFVLIEWSQVCPFPSHRGSVLSCQLVVSI